MNAIRSLLPVIRNLAQGMDLDEFLSSTLDTVVDLTRAERASLMLVEGEQIEPLQSSAVNLDPETVRSEGFAASRTAIRSALEVGKPVVAHDALGNPQLAGAESIRRLKLRSIVAVPLVVKSGTIGVLYADAQSAGAFSEDHMTILEGLAGLCAIALEQTRLTLK